jgi:hypothetical protein
VYQNQSTIKDAVDTPLLTIEAHEPNPAKPIGKFLRNI